MESFDYGNLIRENAQLMQENEKLKRDFVYQVNKKDEYFQELKYLEHENQQLKKELYNSSNKVIELQMRLYDTNIMKTRLLKILNETSDYT